MHDAFKTYARRHLQQQITNAIRSKHATRVPYALGRDDARSQDGVAERRFPKAVTDFVVTLSRHWYSKPYQGGVSFCVVFAMGSILWPSRDRVAGISSRRGAFWANLRRFGNHFGFKKWPPRGPEGSKKEIAKFEIASLVRTISESKSGPKVDIGGGKN